MTEERWAGWTDPREFLQTLPYQMAAHGARFSDRKLRLFAVGCCRRVAHLCPDPRLAAAVHAAEGMVDARTNAERQRPGQVRREILADVEWSRTIPGRLARTVVGRSALGAAIEASWYASYLAGGASERSVRERENQGALLRDVMGNPFRPAVMAAEWRTSTVNALAHGVFADRTFDRLPILADALEDAGCADPDVLAHCRGPGPHVRGCWVIDTLLSKE